MRTVWRRRHAASASGYAGRIGLIDVEAATQTDLPVTQLDGFVQVRNNDIDIEAARFLGIDRCMIINRAAGIRIGRFACESYSKGLKIGDSRDVFVGSFSARGRSPNAVPDPGYNGLSIQDSVRVQCPDVLVEDAAEHAIYVSGGHDAAFTQDIRFGRVVTRRSGQCGFKCKAVNLRSVDVSIDSLSVADAAFRSKPGSNEDGLRVENCNGFRVGLLEVFRDTRRHSCHAGIYLDGVRDFSLGQGRIDGAAGWPGSTSGEGPCAGSGAGRSGSTGFPTWRAPRTGSRSRRRACPSPGRPARRPSPGCRASR